MSEAVGRQYAPQTVLRWMLGVVLREWREQAGKSREDVAAAQRWSPSKVYRIEERGNTVDPRDVAELCDLYRVPPADKEGLVQLAGDAKEGGGWWTEYRDVWSGRYPAFESAASWIDTYESDLIPGLLQTAGIAEAVIRALRPTASCAEIKRRVEARMTRQAMLRDEQRPMRFMLGQGAFRRCAESHPDLAREQFAALLAASERPNVSLRLLPFSSGYRASVESFAMLGFQLSRELRIVYVGGQLGGNYVESPAGLQRYAETWSLMEESARSEEDTAEYMHQELKGLS